MKKVSVMKKLKQILCALIFMRIHFNCIISGVPMLLKNNYKYFIPLLFSAFFICSCDYEPGASSYLQMSIHNIDDVDSDVIIKNPISVSDGEDNNSQYIALENVTCSLRNDEISKGEILAYAESDSIGDVWFCFCTNQEKCKKNDAMYYLSDEDLVLEIEAEQTGATKFYIIVNDPELPGYDEKYETIRRTAARDIYNTADVVYLGKK